MIFKLHFHASAILQILEVVVVVVLLELLNIQLMDLIDIDGKVNQMVDEIFVSFYRIRTLDELVQLHPKKIKNKLKIYYLN